MWRFMMIVVVAGTICLGSGSALGGPPRNGWPGNGAPHNGRPNNGRPDNGAPDNGNGAPGKGARSTSAPVLGSGMIATPVPPLPGSAIGNQPATTFHGTPATACEGGAIRVGQCICPAGQHLDGGHCEAGHSASEAATALRNQAHCFGEEAAALHHAEGMRGAAADARRHGELAADTGAIQVSPGIAHLGNVGNLITSPPAPTDQTTGDASPACSQPDSH